MERPTGSAKARFTIGLLSACLILSACASPTDAADEPDAPDANAVDCSPLEKMETIKYAVLKSAVFGTYYMAEAAKYLEEENLQVEVTPIAAGGDAIAMLGVGNVDAAAVGLSVGAYNALDRGIPVRAVLSQGFPGKDLPSRLYVRSELLKDGTVKEFTDLEGRSVAVGGGPSTSSGYQVGMILEAGGLSWNDVKPVNIAAADIPNALKNGSIDAGYVTSLYQEVVESEGYAEAYGDNDVLRKQAGAAVLLGPTLLEERPAVGCAFVRANLKAARDFFMKEDYNDNPDVVDAFVNIAGIPRDVVLSTPEYQFTPDLEMSAELIEDQQRMFMELGLLKLDEPLPVEAVRDEELRLAAIASLDG